MTDQHMTMTCERLADALDAYLDGAATGAAGVAIDAHLQGCASCRTLVADVRAIRAAAQTLEPIEPPSRVWQGVQARLARATAPSGPRATPADRMAAWIAPGGAAYQALAAAAVLVLLVSGLAWMAGRLGQRPDARSSYVGAGAGTSAVEFQLAEAEYTDAIARLEEATAAAGPRTLDAVTSATLQSSIDDVDSAIGEARDALARVPGDELSRESLLDALGSKVALLQDTVALLSEMDDSAQESTR